MRTVISTEEILSRFQTYSSLVKSDNKEQTSEDKFDIVVLVESLADFFSPERLLHYTLEIFSDNRTFACASATCEVLSNGTVVISLATNAKKRGLEKGDDILVLLRNRKDPEKCINLIRIIGNLSSSDEDDSFHDFYHQNEYGDIVLKKKKDDEDLSLSEIEECDYATISCSNPLIRIPIHNIVASNTNVDISLSYMDWVVC